MRRFCSSSAAGAVPPEEQWALLAALSYGRGDIDAERILQTVRDGWGAGPGYASTAAGREAMIWALCRTGRRDPGYGCPCGGDYDELAAGVLTSYLCRIVAAESEKQDVVPYEKAIIDAGPEAAYIHDTWAVQMFGSYYYLGYSSSSTRDICDAWSLWSSQRRDEHSQDPVPGFLEVVDGVDLSEDLVMDAVATALRTMASRGSNEIIVRGDDLDALDLRDLMRVRSGLAAHGPGFGCRFESVVGGQIAGQGQEVFDGHQDAYNTGWFRLYRTPAQVERLCNRLWTIGSSAPGGLCMLGSFIYGMCDPRHSLIGRLPEPSDVEVVCTWPLTYEPTPLLACDPSLTPTTPITAPAESVQHTRDLLKALCGSPGPDRTTELLKSWERAIRQGFSSNASTARATALPFLASTVRIFRYVLLHALHNGPGSERSGR
jgi:hypothetical protein